MPGILVHAYRQEEELGAFVFKATLSCVAFPRSTWDTYKGPMFKKNTFLNCDLTQPLRLGLNSLVNLENSGPVSTSCMYCLVLRQFDTQLELSKRGEP